MTRELFAFEELDARAAEDADLRKTRTDDMFAGDR